MFLFAVESYISQYKWNQDLMQSLIDDYEIVYPFQVRDRSRIGIDTKNYYFTNTVSSFLPFVDNFEHLFRRVFVENSHFSGSNKEYK